MAYKPHTKITWSGIFGSGSNPYEAWSFGLALAHDDGTALDIAAGTAAEDGLGYGQTFLDAVSTTTAKLTMCKVANVGADGLYVGAPQIAVQAAGAGTGIAQYPTQIALAVSTWSSAATFPRTHGRFYIPAPKGTLDTNTSLMVDSDVVLARNAAKALIDSLNGDFISSSGHVVIASQKGAGANVIVGEIRVGHVFDTMRSRRTSMKEAYDVVAI